MPAQPVPVYGVADHLPRRRPRRLTRRLLALLRRRCPCLPAGVALALLLPGVVWLGGGADGLEMRALPLLLLGAWLLRRGARWLPGGWKAWVS